MRPNAEFIYAGFGIDDGEGLVAMEQGGKLYPIVGEKLETVRMMAEKAVGKEGKAIRIVKYSHPEVIETVIP